jgi:hypothetical protein
MIGDEGRTRLRLRERIRRRKRRREEVKVEGSLCSRQKQNLLKFELS